MNTEHYEILKSGVDNWNAWRKENPNVTPDLGGAHLRGVSLGYATLRVANLSYADLAFADLRSADLRSAYIKFADIRNAVLRYANLWSANLWRANLTDANLGYAYLSEAYLNEADLTGARLTGAHLSGAIGNGKEVCSVTFPERTVTWTATHIFVGCQVKTIEEWFSITDAELDEMSSVARERWRRWEPAIKALIKANPPVKTKA